MLRVLESKETFRLGSSQVRRLNVRIIAATNRDLDHMSDDRFRRDLYFRLNVGRIHLPPLRDRRDDIPLLAEHFRIQLNQQTNQNITGFHDEVLETFTSWDWPGNVRELRNAVEVGFLNAGGDAITRADLPGWFWIREQSPAGETAPMTKNSACSPLSAKHAGISPKPRANCTGRA